MAHSRSAVKRHRQSLRRLERNRARRSAARGAVRRARELIAAGAQEEGQAAVREAVVVLDRAARKGVLHPNNAARRKSRLMRLFHTAQTAAAEKPAPRKRRARAPAKTSTKARASGTKSKTSASKTSGRSTRSKKS